MCSKMIPIQIQIEATQFQYLFFLRIMLWIELQYNGTEQRHVAGMWFLRTYILKTISNNSLILCRSPVCHQNRSDPESHGLWKTSEWVLWYRTSRWCHQIPPEQLLKCVGAYYPAERGHCHYWILLPWRGCIKSATMLREVVNNYMNSRTKGFLADRFQNDDIISAIFS